MTQLLQEQYELVKATRSIVADFLSNEVREDIHTPVPAYAGKTIDQLLQHCGYCYYNWLAAFAMKQPFLDRAHYQTADLYRKVDEVMETFLDKFKNALETPITGIHDSMGELSATPLALFTHVTTHEFHHKGQIMSMCRLLGHMPPDTDVSNFFDTKNP